MTKLCAGPFLALAVCASTMLIWCPTEGHAVQEPPPRESATETGIFRETVRVEVVNVEVFVADQQGNRVTGLQQEDFQLLVDGEPTEITNFFAEENGDVVSESSAGDIVTSEETAASRTAADDHRFHLVLFVDCSQSLPQHRRAVFTKLDAFLDTVLGPGDSVAVVSYDQGLRFHGGFLSDRVELSKVLDQIEDTVGLATDVQLERRRILSEMLGSSAQRLAEADAVVDPGDRLRDYFLNQIRAYAQSTYHANLDSVRALRRVVQLVSGVRAGRKAVLHVSDGIATRPGEGLYEIWKEMFVDLSQGSTYQKEVGSFELVPLFEQVAHEANVAQVTLYAIDAQSDHRAVVRSAAAASGSTRIPSAILTTIEAGFREPIELAATTTGGRRVQRSGSLAKDLRKIAADLGTCYSLGFAATPESRPEPHRIKVKLPGHKKLNVRHRLTFAADTRSADEQMAAEMAAALVLDATNNALQAELEADVPSELASDGSTIPIVVKLPIKNLMAQPGADGFAAKVSFFVLVEDRAGNPGPIRKVTIRLRLPEETYDQARTTFASLEVPATVKPGDQRVVLGIRDDKAGVSGTVALSLASGDTHDPTQSTAPHGDQLPVDRSL